MQYNLKELSFDDINFIEAVQNRLRLFLLLLTLRTSGFYLSPYADLRTRLIFDNRVAVKNCLTVPPETDQSMYSIHELTLLDS